MLFLVFVYLQLLATVLSQSAKAKEHLLEQSKSVEQPPGRTELEVKLVRRTGRGMFEIEKKGLKPGRQGVSLEK